MWSEKTTRNPHKDRDPNRRLTCRAQCSERNYHCGERRKRLGAISRPLHCRWVRYKLRCIASRQIARYTYMYTQCSSPHYSRIIYLLKSFRSNLQLSNAVNAILLWIKSSCLENDIDFWKLIEKDNIIELSPPSPSSSYSSNMKLMYIKWISHGKLVCVLIFLSH